LLVTAAIITIAHLFFLKAHHRALRQSTLQTPPEESDEILQRLGLCDH
jgi:hypothetical protein